jgi:flagellar biogenesis protein FliO
MMRKKMERLRPRTLLWLLSFSCILWMALAPLDARASANWEGPASTRLGGPPTILAGAVTAPISNSKAITPGGKKIKAHAKSAAGSAGTAHRTGTGAKPVRSGSGAAPTSPALNLPAYSPTGTADGQALDGGSIAGLAIKFLVVLVLLFIVLRVLKAIMPRTRGMRSGRDKALLLHSESIGEKQRILLLDLGGKILAVGASGADMTTLATIEDRDAVDALRARYAPLSDTVPGYGEGLTPAPLSRSFVETLKRAGLTLQRQAAETPAAPLAVGVPFLKRAGGMRTGGGVRTRPARAPVGGSRPLTQPASEPILHEALEAMRAARRKVEGA